jgi:hypothetical protein
MEPFKPDTSRKAYCGFPLAVPTVVIVRVKVPEALAREGHHQAETVAPEPVNVVLRSAE